VSKLTDYERYLEDRAARLAVLRDYLSGIPTAHPIVLEAGCGHGHFLTAYATAHPGVYCLGVDLISKRIGRGERKRSRQELANLAFLKADIREVLAVWPSALKVERIFMLFPDPWPKARHHKHRMVQPDLLTALANHTAPNATFHFRTDHPDYFAWTVEQITSHPDWHLAQHLDWPFERITLFQERMGSYQSLTAQVVEARPKAQRG
jgi:tRNA (guanine-N7-)-methyltransferase